MAKGWSYEEGIRQLLQSDGSKMKSKDLYAKAKKKYGLSSATVAKYLKILEEKEEIERTQLSQKNVFYHRCENVRLQHLIDDFMKEIDKTLSELPGEISDIEKQLIKGSVVSKAEGEKAVEVFRSEPIILKQLILNKLADKIAALWNANLPKRLKGKLRYKLQAVPC